MWVHFSLSSRDFRLPRVVVVESVVSSNKDVGVEHETRATYTQDGRSVRPGGHKYWLPEARERGIVKGETESTPPPQPPAGSLYTLCLYSLQPWFGSIKHSPLRGHYYGVKLPRG